MKELGGILSNLDWSVPLELLYSVIPALLCIMIHEISHGLAAYAMGDDTAKRQGRLSLNPFRHIDWFGLAMLAVFHIGWAKPVQVDMRRFRKPKTGMAVTALAGPVSNLLLAVLLVLAYGFLYAGLNQSAAGAEFLKVIGTTAYLSVGLGVFNLIPFPPLDGSKVLFAFLPDRLYEKQMKLERYGMPVLIVIVLFLSRVCKVSPVNQAAEAIMNRLFRLAVWANALTL